MAWTDESKEQAVEMYTAEEPTPENSMEIVKMVAEELGESPNGVRMILNKSRSICKENSSCEKQWWWNWWWQSKCRSKHKMT